MVPQARPRPQPEWDNGRPFVAHALAVLFRAAAITRAGDGPGGLRPEVRQRGRATSASPVGAGDDRGIAPGNWWRRTGHHRARARSASLRGMLDLVQRQDVGVSRAATLGVINILLALVAGLLFGNLLLPTRRNLWRNLRPRRP